MKLEQRIKLNKLELEDLRKLATSVSSARYGIEKVQTSKKNDAYFIKYLEKIEELEEKIKKNRKFNFLNI